MLGTRFVATRESRAHPDYKQRLVDARHGSTALTILFRRRLAARAASSAPQFDLGGVGGGRLPSSGRRPRENDVLGHASNGEPLMRYEDVAPRAGMAADAEAMAMYAGTGVGRISDLPGAGEVLLRLWEEAASVVRSGAGSEQTACQHGRNEIE